MGIMSGPSVAPLGKGLDAMSGSEIAATAIGIERRRQGGARQLRAEGQVIVEQRRGMREPFDLSPFPCRIMVEDHALDAGAGRGEKPLDKYVAAARERQQQVVGMRGRTIERHLARLDAAGKDELVGLARRRLVEDRVVAVAVEIDVGVAAGAADKRVIAQPAIEDVVTAPAEQDIVGLVAEDAVGQAVAFAADGPAHELEVSLAVVECVVGRGADRRCIDVHR